MVTVAQRNLALKHLNVSRCTHLHPSALLPLAQGSGPRSLNSLLALDIGLEENEDNGTASVAIVLLALPSLRQVALDSVGQACVLIQNQDFGLTEGFTSQQGVASLQELWAKRVKGGDKVDEEDSLEESLDKGLRLDKSKPDGVRTDQKDALELGLQDVQSVSLSSLDALGRLCPNLCSVSLNGHNEDDDDNEGFRRTALLTRGLGRWSGQLRSLSLQFSGFLSELVPPLQATGSSLISLTVEGVRADGHLPFLELVRACPKLTTLTIHIDPPRSNQENDEEDEDLEDWNMPCLPYLCSLTLQ